MGTFQFSFCENVHQLGKGYDSHLGGSIGDDKQRMWLMSQFNIISG